MTDCLYYSDPTLRSFSARVVGRLEIDNHPAVILDRTAFYPEGGGQPGDRRQINQAQVIDVQAHDDAAHSACPERSRRVVHILSDPVAEDEVTCAIDWTRRFDLMQQHSGQHILSQAFVRLLDAETVAFHLNDDPNEGTVTIDLDRAGLRPVDVDAVENLANQIVFENRPVTARFVSGEELASIPLRKPPTVVAAIRIVDIAEFDRSACGGTHVARTGEVGQIKIVKLERRGPETRVEFRCGQRALADYRRKNDVINRAAAGLSIGFWELEAAAARLVAENKALFKQLEEAQERLLEFDAHELLSNLREHGQLAVAAHVWHARDMNALRKLAKQVISRPRTVALLGSGGEKPALVFARSSDVAFDMSQLVRDAAAHIGGRGGGSPDFAQAGGPPANDEQVQAAIEWAGAQLRNA